MPSYWLNLLVVTCEACQISNCDARVLVTVQWLTMMNILWGLSIEMTEKKKIYIYMEWETARTDVLVNLEHSWRFRSMEGSGGWSDSLTCSIGGRRSRCGNRSRGGWISCNSSPLLLLPQRGLFAGLSHPVFLLQLESAKKQHFFNYHTLQLQLFTERYSCYSIRDPFLFFNIKKSCQLCVLELHKFYNRTEVWMNDSFASAYQNRINFRNFWRILTVRAWRATSDRERPVAACRDCSVIRRADTTAVQETTEVSAFHTSPSTSVPLTCNAE